jgi:hypothetical protein
MHADYHPVEHYNDNCAEVYRNGQEAMRSDVVTHIESRLLNAEDELAVLERKASNMRQEVATWKAALRGVRNI